MDIPWIKRIEGEINRGLGKGKKKMANRVSRRSTTYPCFFPDLGEFSRSWPYRFAVTNVGQDFFSRKHSSKKDRKNRLFFLLQAPITYSGYAYLQDIS